MELRAEATRDVGHVARATCRLARAPGLDARPEMLTAGFTAVGHSHDHAERGVRPAAHASARTQGGDPRIHVAQWGSRGEIRKSRLDAI